ncbi:GNAT family N-acetyltransferase [Shewanella sp. AS1]|nr:GNAT family N-acetyltransferase [Shewanella sp. AS1]
MFAFSRVDEIAQIGQAAWHSLFGDDDPFMRYEFLHGLETSGCVGAQSGWLPSHLMVKQDNSLIALLPLYIKYHSYGEYVFDWAWAEAYERHQLNYYPKLVSAVPFTPITGSRIGFTEQLDTEQRQALVLALNHYLSDWLKELGGSGWHQLFHRKREHDYFAKAGSLTRLGTQFHWHNRSYRDFEDFLAQMSSRKRKNIRKEREQLKALALRFDFIDGDKVTSEQLAHFYLCYRATYAKRSGHGGYLNLDFFSQILASMGKAVRLLMVEQEGKPVAAALYFVSKERLYGRYWGSLVEIPGLHFETCYYQGIEYAISHGFKVFDAGAQGEHKVLRGFEPVETYSAHEILHPQFRDAIAAFTLEEKRNIRQYMAQLRQVLPYKKTVD